ncbi:MAG: hypothetical protein OEZ55_08135 [Nitrospinota bacterium]|nr:hypothetical protein [Nitrospinota bacterium]
MNNIGVFPNSKIRTFVLALCALFIISCGDGGGKTDNEPPAQTSNCGPTHEMAGFTTAWEYTQCPQADTMWVDQSTVDANGVPLADREVSWGMLAVKYYGLHNGKFLEGENFGVMFKAWGYEFWNGELKQNVFGEANWQIWAHNNGVDELYSKLIIQRFDGQCKPFCEQADYHKDMQFLDEQEEVQINCAWNFNELEDGKVWCDITKLTSGEVHNFWNIMKGRYTSLDYAGVGKKAFDGPYHGFPGPVSDFKVTILQ